MITDPKDGIKIAECPEEALWEKVRKARELSINNLEENLIIEKAFLRLAEEKLKKFHK